MAIRAAASASQRRAPDHAAAAGRMEQLQAATAGAAETEENISTMIRRIRHAKGTQAATTCTTMKAAAATPGAVASVAETTRVEENAAFRSWVLETPAFKSPNVAMSAEWNDELGYNNMGVGTPRARPAGATDNAYTHKRSWRVQSEDVMEGVSCNPSPRYTVTCPGDILSSPPNNASLFGCSAFTTFDNLYTPFSQKPQMTTAAAIPVTSNSNPHKHIRLCHAVPSSAPHSLPAPADLAQADHFPASGAQVRAPGSTQNTTPVLGTFGFPVPGARVALVGPPTGFFSNGGNWQAGGASPVGMQLGGERGCVATSKFVAMSRSTLWIASVAVLLILACAVTEVNHASKPVSSSELPETVANYRRILSPTSRRLLSRDGGGFSDSEMEAMHDSMWRWRNSMDRSRRRGGRGGGGGMMGGRSGGGMMGGRGEAEKESAENEAVPAGDCGGNGGGESQEAPHLELIRRSMRAVGLIEEVSEDSTSAGAAAAAATNGGSNSVMHFGGRRGMNFPLMHMHHGRMHVPMMGMDMGMGNVNVHPMQFRAGVESPKAVPLRDSTPCSFFSSICDFFRRVFGASSPAIKLPSNEDTTVGSSAIRAQYPRRMMHGREALDTASMSTFDAFKNSLVNGLVMENAQEHDMMDVPGNENVMLLPTGDDMVGRQMDDKEMEGMMRGMMGRNRMMLRGGNV
ncbi:unnamed protein product [Closterium sp. Yama58-4]|nr:unnamed protein product [Closterium sp. Yama58-4]